MPADRSNNFAVSIDGSIIAAGWSAGSTPICYALAEYGSNGVLSTKTASAVSTGSGSAYSAEHGDIAIQANAEKIVTAGWVSNGSDNDFFIPRHNLPATPPSSLRRSVASLRAFVPLPPTGIGTARTIPSLPC